MRTEETTRQLRASRAIEGQDDPGDQKARKRARRAPRGLKRDAGVLRREGRPEWGDKYEQAIEMFGKSYDTVKQYKSVSGAYELCERSHNLPWSHHLAVAYVDSPDLRAELLAEAEPEEDSTEPRLSVAELRDRVRQHKREAQIPERSGNRRQTGDIA